MKDNETVKLNDLERNSRELCELEVEDLIKILNNIDWDYSYEDKVKAIVAAGRRIEKLNYIHEFATYKIHGNFREMPTNELERIQYVMYNELKP